MMGITKVVSMAVSPGDADNVCLGWRGDYQVNPAKLLSLPAIVAWDVRYCARVITHSSFASLFMVRARPLFDDNLPVRQPSLSQLRVANRNATEFMQ